MTTAATGHLSPEFRTEQPLHVLIGIVANIEARDKLFRFIAPIHVDRDMSAVISADVSRQDMQLSPLIVPGRALVFNEYLD